MFLPCEHQNKLSNTWLQSNASKTQALIDEHQGKSPEELVAAKIINADQKKQVDNLNKLKAEIVRYEEQLVQFQKIDEEYRAKLASAKAETEKTLSEKYEQEKADAVAEAKDKAEADAKKSLHDGFLVLSQFLRLAAHRRAEAPGSEDDEDMALEGILLSVYGGDEPAVAAMLRLYEGTEDETTGVDGAALQTTCKSRNDSCMPITQQLTRHSRNCQGLGCRALCPSVSVGRGGRNCFC